MEYKEYKSKLIAYINSGLRYPEDKSDEEIEEFFEFIDELEAKAESDKKYYELVSDAYVLMRDYKKAHEAFYKFHDPANPKHLKKLYSYEGLRWRPITTPLIRMLTAMDKGKIDVLTKNTPTCSNEFEIFNEEVWETCCDDFCCYKKKVDDVFYFQCIHCGKKIKLIEQT